MNKLFLAGIVMVCCSGLFADLAGAKTLILEGKLDGSVAMRQVIEFSVDKGTVSSFSFRFALPATFSSRTVSQSIEGFEVNITPRPASSIIETDQFGNRFQRVTWEHVSQNILVKLDYTAGIRAVLTDLQSSATFPLGNQASDQIAYLKPSSMVQSNAPEISVLARQLTKDSRNQYEAVMAVTNWVADNVKYTFNPPRYDALHTLSTKSGNCQNLAHLSIALLRNVGIPARIVGGITLKDSWKVPIDARNSIVQSMGQGGHAWLEVWFPDLGWLPYDPQQSKQFTSTRHIKQSHGIDSKDINDTWRGAPYLPAYSEMIEGRFTTDATNLKMKRLDSLPRPYLLSNLITAAGGVAIVAPLPSPSLPSRPGVVQTQPGKPKTPSVESGDSPTGIPVGTGDVVSAVDKVPTKPITPPATTPPSGSPKPDKPALQVSPPQPQVAVTPVVVTGKSRKKPSPGTRLTFGNMEFPALVNLYSVKGNTGTRIFERETSEYVTSKYIYAQAFQVTDLMTLDRISLAMRKFGGDGSVYIDVVKDRLGKPDIMHGVRSNLVDLEKIPRNRPGYYWVDFSFPLDGNRPQQLDPGKYWIVFRASGEAIINWFFTPGKPYSGGDDTRSTAKGFQWEDILNYDFVFKVNGKTI